MPPRRLAVLLVVSLAACSQGTPRVGGRASSPTLGAPTGAPTTIGSTTVRPGAGNGTVAPPATATTARPGIVVPRAGRYTYDVTEQEHDEVGPTTVTYEQTAEIDRPVSRDDDVSIEIRTTSARTEAVTGEVFVFLRTRIDLLFADGCVLDEPAAHYRLPLRAGASWPSPRSCEGESDTATTRVVSKTAMRVGGVRVETFVVRRTTSLGDARATKTQWFAPAYMLVVRSELDDTVEGEPHRVVQILRSLTPA